MSRLMREALAGLHLGEPVNARSSRSAIRRPRLFDAREPGWCRPRLAFSVQAWTRAASTAGVGLGHLLHATGLTPTQLRDPHAVVVACQEIQLIRNIQSRAADPIDIAMRAGHSLGYHDYGPFGKRLLHSETVRSAVEFAVRFQQHAHALTAIVAQSRRNGLVLHFDARQLPLDLQRMALARDIASWSRVTADLMTPGANARSLLKRSRKRDIDSSLTVVTTLAIDGRMLGSIPPEADAEQCAHWEARCLMPMAISYRACSMSDVVRTRLKVQASQLPNFETIAFELGVTSRTASGLLAKEGTTFRELAREARFELARALLRDRGLTISEISRRLGYAHLPAFTKAFQQVHGVTPTHYRAMLQSFDVQASEELSRPQRSEGPTPGC